ncbi:MAG: F0F1 ATP synthase subunit B [Bacteroidota bacterium]|nr:F0F1 ATP synthase subunit B [Bacteroidota bacterium]
MILLNALLKPDLGLMFWTMVIFLLLLFILRKYAWKPITEALKAREDSIEKALNEAKNAREEIAELKQQNESFAKEAKLERDKMLKDAKEKSDKIIEASKANSKKEQKKIMSETRELVKKEKDKAFNELKKEIGEIIISTATKVIKKELENPEKQKDIIKESLKDL